MTYTIIEGQLVSQKISQIVQAIHEYDPDIHVEWMPDKKEQGLPQFRIVYRPVNEPEFILFHVKDETLMDERVLMRIIQNDQRNGKVTLSDFEAWEAARKRVEHQKFLDELEELEDISKHILSTPLNSYRVNKDLVIKDGIPHNAAHLDSNGKPLKGSHKDTLNSLGRIK